MQNREYKSDKGNRVIITGETKLELQLCVITPRTDAAQKVVITREEFARWEQKGKLKYVRTGLFNCMYN